MPDEQRTSLLQPYVVTARHSVDATAGAEFYVRFNTEAAFDDIPTQSDYWYRHDTADVAVLPLDLAPRDTSDYRTAWTPPSQWVGDDNSVPIRDMLGGAGVTSFFAGEIRGYGMNPTERVIVEVGHEVVFVGLLQHQHGEARNLPIARFGHIARMPSEPVGIEGVGCDPVFLAECHSWGGNSGSPCYLRHPVVMQWEVDDERPGHAGTKRELSAETDVLALLGLVSGHFNIDQEAETIGDILGEIRVALNSGIAIITPVKAMRHLLLREDVRQDRNARTERWLAAHPQPASH